jgi:PKD repeat protein
LNPAYHKIFIFAATVQKYYLPEFRNLNYYKMNRYSCLFRIFSFCFIMLTGLMSYAQISEGGAPPSFTINNIREEFNQYDFSKPDMELINLEDQANAESAYPGPERMAYSVLVNLDVREAGTSEVLADGSTIRRMKIHVPDALALGVYYSNFYLPQGCKLFLYNESKTQVIGAFTSANNTENGLFATEFIQGDKVTLEYFEPAGVTEKAEILISEVAYGYRFIYFDYVQGNRDQSWSCMINVKCSEGTGWENQIQGIARLSIKIGFSYYWCSGSLINNTNNDRTPYLLTAEHCGEGANASDLNQWIFYFNYQSATCSGNYGPSSSTVTGCQLKSKDPLTGFDGSDWELVRLNSTPPTAYNVYYNGWNRTNTPADSGKCLHHPAGDIKKVSTYSTPMISSTWWNGTPSHWRVTWSETEHGLSIMQGGSSGSPIFDQDHLIMGDLSGGYTSNACDNPSPAWFGKVWYSWDQMGSTPATRLMDWLDPEGTGDNKYPGLSSQILPPVVDFTSDTTHVIMGTPVQFTDLTTGNPALAWDWSFPGGTPNASDVQNPTVTYNQWGVFDVTLTVTNADGENTEVKTGYMTVDQVLAPETDFSASAVDLIEGDIIDFSDLTINEPTSWAWSFEGATTDTSNEQNPAGIEYLTPGVYDVTLTATNNGGTDTEYKDNYITVNAGMPPISNFYADVTQIMPGDSVNFFDLSTGTPTQWTWTFTGADPGGSSTQNPTGIVYNTEGYYNVKLRTKNSFGNNTLEKENYIHVGNVSVKDLYLTNGVKVYPNPSQGDVKVVILEGMEAWGKSNSVTVEVVNSLGNVIMSFNNDLANRQLSIDLKNEPDGLYIIRVSSGNRTVQKKISLLR